MFSLFISVISFIFILSIVVFVHEFGHYIIAIFNKVKVDEFAIGYGREIFGWTDKRGTRWKVCSLPLGGFVKFYGDEEASSSMINSEKLGKMTKDEKEICIYFKNVWQRISIAFAGPFFNYLLSIFLFTLFFYMGGSIEFSNKITHIEKNSPAEKYGLMVSDRIIKINDSNIENFNDISIELSLIVDDVVNITLDRDGQIIKKEVKLDNGKNIIGVSSSDFVHNSMTILGALSKSFEQVIDITRTTLKALGQMLMAKRGLNSISGPISIARYSGKAVENGFFSILHFIALISVSLGIMNLLPIPVLDGGHLMFYFFEVIRRKPLTDKAENIFNKIGFSILITLMVFVTIKDIFGIF